MWTRLIRPSQVVNRGERRKIRKRKRSCVVDSFISGWTGDGGFERVFIWAMREGILCWGKLYALLREGLFYATVWMGCSGCVCVCVVKCGRENVCVCRDSWGEKSGCIVGFGKWRFYGICLTLLSYCWPCLKSIVLVFKVAVSVMGKPKGWQKGE